MGNRCVGLYRIARHYGLGPISSTSRFLLHRAAGTPHVGLGLVSSFSLAAIAAAFTWYAMRHGALLGGTSSTTLRDDFHNLPAITLALLLVVPRKVSGFVRE